MSSEISQLPSLPLFCEIRRICAGHSIAYTPTWLTPRCDGSCHETTRIVEGEKRQYLDIARACVLGTEQSHAE